LTAAQIDKEIGFSSLFPKNEEIIWRYITHSGKLIVTDSVREIACELKGDHLTAMNRTFRGSPLLSKL
jgi:hypothetical protein